MTRANSSRAAWVFARWRPGHGSSRCAVGPARGSVRVPRVGPTGCRERLFGLAIDHTGAEFAEHGVIEAGIVRFQGEGVLPVDATAVRHRRPDSRRGPRG